MMNNEHYYQLLSKDALHETKPHLDDLEISQNQSQFASGSPIPYLLDNLEPASHFLQCNYFLPKKQLQYSSPYLGIYRQSWVSMLVFPNICPAAVSIILAELHKK